MAMNLSVEKTMVASFLSSERISLAIQLVIIDGKEGER